MGLVAVAIAIITVENPIESKKRKENLLKSYNHLYEQFISDENIRIAIQKSHRRNIRNKPQRYREQIKRIKENPDKYIESVRDYADNYLCENHNPVEIYDGITRKKRVIIVPSMGEQILHHMLMNVLVPIMQKSMYFHSYGSIPKKGCHKGKRYLSKWMNTNSRDVKYCLKLDIKKFFQSIPHDIMMKKFKEKIHDKRFLNVISEIMKSSENGIPIGFYTSQWFANWYLQGLDNYIKQDLHIKYYMRYMDDMVLLSSNKKELAKVLNDIRAYSQTELGLELKQNYQIFKTRKRFIDFMGFKFYRNRVTLRKSIFLKVLRKARRIAKKEKPTIHDLRQMLSGVGWLKHCDTYNAFQKYIKPNVDIQQAKRRISNYDRRVNYEMEHKRKFRISDSG